MQNSYTGQVPADSFPVARDRWGIFELIVKESGDEVSDVEYKKKLLLLLL